MKRLRIEDERCKSCGLCAEACPKKIIRISEDKMNSRGYRPAEVIDEKQCIGCACCALVCPDCVITVSNNE